ncbi:MAG: AAA family ATPase [Agathobacter sp.]|nr:AAA family ATPase [Agathobacter sp.]
MIKNNKKRYWMMILWSLMVIGVILLSVSYINKDKIDVATMQVEPYTTMVTDIDADNIEMMYYTTNHPDVYILTKEGVHYKTSNPEYDSFKKDMLDKGLKVRPVSEFLEQNKEVFSFVHMFGIIIAIMVIGSCILRLVALRYLTKNGDEDNPLFASVTPSGGKAASSSSSGSEPKSKEKAKSFNDIAGLYEVKKDMKCLVDFLKNQDKYLAAGAELPKGVIFYGPPGTGKTLLAKAIAGEAGVPFHYMSGSDFVEMYVGMGAKRVRELFQEAKKKTPCIVFIDEIDAIGGKRSAVDSNGEDRKTLNALLTEMDGFNKTENILVIAATNRLEDLDAALVRPGRFTNKFCVPVPETTKERMEVIKLYAKNKKFNEEVDFHALSKEIIGFSPAAIESLLNESAIISVQDEKPVIDKASIDKAMIKVLMSGHIKENQSERNKEELRLVAWHEAGHALVGKLNGKHIPKVTILSTTSGAGGVTFSTPKEIGLYSVDDLKAEISELYAGRVAELMLLKDKNKVTTGASNDIEKATNIIREIVASYGMSDEFGMLNLNQLRVDPSKIISEEVKLAKEIEKNTIELLTTHYKQLEAIAMALIEKETLYEDDLIQIIENIEVKPIQPKDENPTPTVTKKEPAKQSIFKEVLGKIIRTQSDEDKQVAVADVK